MELKLRSGTPEDAEICGTICYNAFRTISEAHGFAPDFPAPEVAIGLLKWMLTHPQFYSVVAEINGGIVGSNFSMSNGAWKTKRKQRKQGQQRKRNWRSYQPATVRHRRG